jgi:2-phosphosulfolactate phosphatase
MPTPYDQSRYQVRLEHGVAGARRLAASDVVIVVDVLSDPDAATGPADEIAAAAAEGGALVLLGHRRPAAAAARAVRTAQERRSARTSVAIVTADAVDADGAPRLAVEDLLGAGAIVDALGALGIDHTSPESAAACEAFRGLRGAVKHLLTAAGSGQALLAEERRADVLAASVLDADDTPRVWSPPAP